MGIVRFAILTNGQFFEAKNSLKIQQVNLVKLQRQLSHKKKFSQNWKKQKLSKYHVRIANIRRDYLYKITQQLSKNHAIGCMEDLKITNMLKSAKANAEQHGKNVKQKSGLNRPVLDQSWFEFKRQLSHKLL